MKDTEGEWLAGVAVTFQQCESLSARVCMCMCVCVWLQIKNHWKESLNMYHDLYFPVDSHDLQAVNHI